MFQFLRIDWIVVVVDGCEELLLILKSLTFKSFWKLQQFRVSIYDWTIKFLGNPTPSDASFVFWSDAIVMHKLVPRICTEFIPETTSIEATWKSTCFIVQWERNMKTHEPLITVSSQAFFIEK